MSWPPPSKLWRTISAARGEGVHRRDALDAGGEVEIAADIGEDEMGAVRVIAEAAAAGRDLDRAVPIDETRTRVERVKAGLAQVLLLPSRQENISGRAAIGGEGVAIEVL